MDAEIVQAALRGAGIEAVVEAASELPLGFSMPAPLSPLHVSVPDDRAEEALRVLRELLEAREAAEAPAAGSPPAAAAPAPEPPQPPSPHVTALAVAVVVGMLLLEYWPRWTRDPADRLRAPELFAYKVLGRELEEAATWEAAPGWQRFWGILSGYEPKDTLERARDAFRAAYRARPQEHARWKLAVLEAEAGDRARAMVLAPGPTETDGSLGMWRDLRDAYGPDPPGEVAPGASEEGPFAWFEDTVSLRVAERRGDSAAADRAREGLVRRGLARWREWAPLEAIELALIGLGLAILGIGWLRGRAWPVVGGGVTVAPWTVGRGLATWFRGRALAEVFSWVIVWWAARGLRVVYAFHSALTAIPLILLGTGQLLRPAGLGLRSGFGLARPPAGLALLAAATLALLSLDWTGGRLLGCGLSRVGVSSHWSEWPQEFLLLAGPAELALDLLDSIVWAPIFEEIVFRGFLYTTLRSRLGPLASAGLSGLVFGATHVYDLPGFLEIAWMGFVGALAYERTRSLLPCMLAHSIHNILASAWPILLYR